MKIRSTEKKMARRVNIKMPLGKTCRWQINEFIKCISEEELLKRPAILNMSIILMKLTF